MTFLFLAQQQPASSTGISMGGFVFQILAMIAIFWFFLIRPQQKERRNLEAQRMQLKRGDEVITSGGIVAEVVHIQMQPAAEGKEPAPSMADRVTVRSGEAKFVMERAGIARITPKG